MYNYRVPQSSSVAAADGDADILVLLPSTNRTISLVGLRVGVTTEFGDAQDEVLDLAVVHMTATVSGNSGSAITPVKRYPAKDPAASFTVTGYDATVATTTGTTTTVEYIPVNVRSGSQEFWWNNVNDAPLALTAVSGEVIIIRLLTAVADTLTLTVTAFVKED